MNTSAALCELTVTELLVLQFIAYEYSSKQIADILFVSDQTIYTHRANILLKLDVKNSAGMIRKAIEMKLLKPLSEVWLSPRISAEVPMYA